MFQVSKPEMAVEAEVVEVFEKDGRRIAKVLVHSFFLEIDADNLSGAHLGDKVVLTAGAAQDAAPVTRIRRSK